MTGQFEFVGVCKLTLEYTKGATKSQHVATDIFLEVGKNIDRKMYLDKNQLPTAEGYKVLTNVFIQGLIGCIHAGEQKGFKPSAEALRYVMEQLAKGFANPASVQNSTFTGL